MRRRVSRTVPREGVSARVAPYSAAPLRPGAHLPLLQADPQLDHAACADSAAGGSLDLVGGPGLHPAPPGAADDRGCAPAVGASPTPRSPRADRRPCPPPPPRRHKTNRLSAAGHPVLVKSQAKTAMTTTAHLTLDQFLEIPE